MSNPSPQPPTLNPRLSVALLARDEAAHLPACLHSVAALSAPPAGELGIVLDSRATATVEAIARRATPHVSREPFVNYSAQRNRALARCRGEWVFLIDPDERATPALVAEINALINDGGGIGGAWVPRRNRMFGH